jgi:hypothetical protein
VSSSKPAVIISLTGGLGNQLFQIAAALNLARGKQVAIERDLGDPRINSAGLPDALDFDWPPILTLLPSKNRNLVARKAFSISRRINISSKKYRDLPGISLLRVATSIIISIYLKSLVTYEAARGVGYQKLTLKSKTTFLTGYFQSYIWPSETEIFKILMNLYLKAPSPEFKVLENNAKELQPVILHVRLGDYKNETSFGIPNQNYYSIAVKKMFETYPDMVIWVFSNELDLARSYLPSQYSDRYQFIDDSLLTPAEILELMRNGRGYIIGNSTFSWWSAFLGYESNALVICPDPWFQIQESPLEIIPPHWHRIGAWN